MKLLLLLRLWNYLRGYVIILVEGYFIEKFLNVCTHRQIYLWDIKWQKNCIITLKISIKGFMLLRPVAKKTKCRVRIIKKKGIPFILNKYRKRKAFFAGAFLFLLLIYIMTSFVWSVEIIGNKNLTTEYLENALSSNGIRPGTLKYSVNTDNAVSGMMLDVKELSWISIDLKGTKIKVQLRERKPLPVMVPKDVPCDIIALKDGFIKQIIVTDGIEAVFEGDTVKKGQILISGRIPIANDKDKFRLVHAMGSVMARTWYEEQCPVAVQDIKKVRTGKEINNYSLILFTKEIGIYNKKVDYENYDTVQVKKRLSIGEDLVFPFELVKNSYYENELIAAKINEDDAKKAAVDAAYKILTERLPQDIDIIKNDIRFAEEGDTGLIAKITLECLEEIGMTQEIGGK